MKPMIDTTSEDWFPLQGQEKNGWTAIQFKRSFDTCDTMDYPITVRNIPNNEYSFVVYSLERII